MSEKRNKSLFKVKKEVDHLCNLCVIMDCPFTEKLYVKNVLRLPFLLCNDREEIERHPLSHTVFSVFGCRTLKD